MDNKRQIISYDRFIELTGTKLFICLDQGIMEICRYLLNTRGTWRTTYTTEYGEVGYTLPTEEEFQAVLSAISEANVDMASCEELNTTLQGILEAIEGLTAATVQSSGCGPCGGGSRGAGTSEAEPNPYDQGESPTTPPPGFSSMTQFNQQKCNAAYDIITNLKNDLQGVAALDYVSNGFNDIVVLVLAVVLTPIPWDDIALLVGLLIFAGIEYTFLVEISSEIFDNADDLACELYNSDSAAEAQVNLRTALNALVDAQGWIEAEEDFVKSALEYMTPLDAINRMFVNTPTTTQDADCSLCSEVDALFVPEPGYTPPIVLTGTYGGTITLRSQMTDVFGGVRHAVILKSVNTPSNHTLHIDSINEAGAGNAAIDWHNAGTPQPQDNFSGWSGIDGWEEACSAFAITSDSVGTDDPFEITITFSA